MKPLKDPEGFEKKTLHKYVSFEKGRCLAVARVKRTFSRKS